MLTKRRAKQHRPELVVYLETEAPRIGCGWRGVRVIKRGRKWTRIVEVASLRTGKIDNRTFAQIEARAR